MSGLVLALVGTDHHPFDRLVDWIDEAAVRHRGTRFVVQHGASKAPLVAEGHEFLVQERMSRLLRDARVVVCHGGPGTIMDARSAGHVPICVPRDPRYGEHVDGHQLRFSELVGSADVVRRVSGAEAFRATLDDLLLADGGGRRQIEGNPMTLHARELLAVELDQLVLTAPSRLGRRRRRVL